MEPQKAPNLPLTLEESAIAEVLASSGILPTATPTLSELATGFQSAFRRVAVSQGAMGPDGKDTMGKDRDAVANVAATFIGAARERNPDLDRRRLAVTILTLMMGGRRPE